ncbi:MAG: Crp/Fnr family transcriptional regulator [Saprospiraceae bacterium]|nr:Crp/Fnr family transcriptional regulator [Saprospiraceae bacterium]
MSKDALIHFFQLNIPTSKQVINDIVAPFEERDLSKNDFFLTEGKLGSEYMYLEQGFLRAFTLNTEGAEVTTHFYTPRSMVFEVASFFNRTISQESIQAMTDCKGYVITFEQLNHLFHTIPEFREFGRSRLVTGFVALKQRTLSLINETAEERYKNLLVSNPEIFQHAPLKQIASYLGVTDTSLSRIRRDFQKK